MPEIVTQELAAEASGFLTAARGFKITSAEQYELAGARLKGIKALREKIATTFDPHIKRAHEAHKALIREKQDAEAPLVQAEATYKGALIAYQDELNRKAREEQARLEEQARKERERLEARAAKAEEKGKEEKAEALRMQAATVATPVVSIAPPKVSGISTRESWKARVTDKMALVKAVAEGKVPLTALDVNATFLANQARALKTELNYPGVEVYKDTVLASRSA